MILESISVCSCPDPVNRQTSSGIISTSRHDGKIILCLCASSAGETFLMRCKSRFQSRKRFMRVVCGRLLCFIGTSRPFRRGTQSLILCVSGIKKQKHRRKTRARISCQVSMHLSQLLYHKDKSIVKKNVSGDAFPCCTFFREKPVFFMLYSGSGFLPRRRVGGHTDPWPAFR